MNTALVEEFSQDKITIQIVKYENFFISKIPSKIKFTFSDINIKGTLETTKILLILDTNNENKS
jgi:hypothetical protein